MSYSLIPSKFLSRLPSLLEESEDFLSGQSGLSISEDKTKIYIEASMPGLNPKDIDVTLDKGILQIKGEKKEEIENKEKKFYRREKRSYFYQLALPSQIDDSTEPSTSYKNGILEVNFTKAKQSQTRKISVK